MIGVNRRPRLVWLRRIVGLGLVPALSIACGGGSPTAPTTDSTSVSVSGTWVGTTTNSLAPGLWPAQATVAQSGTNLSGNWSATLPNGTNGGPLSGSIVGNMLSISFNFAVPVGACRYAVTATVNGNQLAGTWTTVGCVTAANGNLTLTKQ